MTSPQTKFHAHTMKESKLLGQKKSKFIVGVNFSCSRLFSLYRYFIEATTTYWYAFAILFAIL